MEIPKQRAQAHDKKKQHEVAQIRSKKQKTILFFFTICFPNICCLKFYFQIKFKYKFACLLFSNTLTHTHTHIYIQPFENKTKVTLILINLALKTFRIFLH